MRTGGLREHSLLWNDKGNAGAKTAECTACPVLTGSTRFRATLIPTCRSFFLKFSLLYPLSNVLESHTYKNIRIPIFKIHYRVF